MYRRIGTWAFGIWLTGSWLPVAMAENRPADSDLAATSVAADAGNDATHPVPATETQIDPALLEALKSPKSASDAELARLMNYNLLIRLPARERHAFFTAISRQRLATFANGLPPVKRAILMTDPFDCSWTERLKRRVVGTYKADEGFASNSLQDLGNSLALGTLERVAPGLGSLASAAAKVREAAERKQMRAEYVEFCGMSKEQQDALLFPSEQAAQPDQDRKEEGTLEIVTKVLAR